MFVNSASVRDSNLTCKGDEKRIDKVGKRFQTLMEKIDNIHQKVKQTQDKPTCKHCGKNNHL